MIIINICDFNYDIRKLFHKFALTQKTKNYDYITVITI